jgi:hypothetical protein
MRLFGHAPGDGVGAAGSITLHDPENVESFIDLVCPTQDTSVAVLAASVIVVVYKRWSVGSSEILDTTTWHPPQSMGLVVVTVER